ncbi:hypothetical protein LJE71_16790 [Xanthobacter autotrophicus]|uniref:hypothetical protein n=1 Tax=Xanthobacter autotrophicus TaxID=280 RepID=UPI001E528DEB|nr:hypothetical protein [Xanthobacter autotrophicus]UDQ87933.1 hypothetical protein LJE71_16790 [Xanthobacter autotrophicus]
MAEDGSDAERPRHATDTGQNRDKVRGPDFAAAPLGTDDEASGHTPRQDWRPPEQGDRIADGDPSIGALYEPQSEEDNRAHANAPPNWGTWALVAAGVLVLGLAAASLAS